MAPEVDGASIFLFRISLILKLTFFSVFTISETGMHLTFDDTLEV